MDKEILIKLLQLQFEHNRKIEEFAGKINLTYLEIDLLSVVLDALEVPADNTIEQIEKYGYYEWLDQPDTCSRYSYYEEFKKRVKQGNDEECRVYLETIAATRQPCYAFDLSLLDRASLNSWQSYTDG